MCSCPVVRAALGRPLARYSSKMTASQWAAWPAAVAQRAERGSVAVQARNRLQDLLADLRAEDTEVEENNVPVGKRRAAAAVPLPAACTTLLVASLRGRGIVDNICSQFTVPVFWKLHLCQLRLSCAGLRQQSRESSCIW